MLPIVQREYFDIAGCSPFRRWLNGLDDVAIAKVLTALDRLSHGNISHVKAIGAGVSELKSNFGPGYRVYFGRDGEALVILLGGGTKAQQQRDIRNAQDRWEDYKRRRR